MIWSLNRGEWSEGYVFLKLLGDGRIYAGTPDLKKIDSSYLDIENIIKRFDRETYVYERTQIGRCSAEIRCLKDQTQFLILPSKVFSEHAEDLRTLIISSGKGKLSAETVQQFFEYIGIKSIKSPSLSDAEIEEFGGKTDIFLTTRNNIDGLREKIGFSIKSHFGSPATLLNCGAGTKFIYRIEGCTKEEAIKLNSLDTIKDQLTYIRKSPNLSIEYEGSNLVSVDDGNGNKIIGPVFDWNLEHIDSRMSEIISTMLLCINGYYDELPASRSIPDIVTTVTKVNPIGYKIKVGNPYETKFKSLLFAAFSGLTASTYWDGKNRVSGGYLDVSKNGEILYFRALSDDQFMSYLYNSTVVDAPSRGNRHKVIHDAALQGKMIENIDDIKGDHGDYGYVYEEVNDDYCGYCLAINFQIRFKH